MESMSKKGDLCRIGWPAPNKNAGCERNWGARRQFRAYSRSRRRKSEQLRFMSGPMRVPFKLSAMQPATHIHVKGAREHNLKNWISAFPGEIGRDHRTQRFRANPRSPSTLSTRRATASTWRAFPPMRARCSTSSSGPTSTLSTGSRRSSRSTADRRASRRGARSPPRPRSQTTRSFSGPSRASSAARRTAAGCPTLARRQCRPGPGRCPGERIMLLAPSIRAKPSVPAGRIAAPAPARLPEGAHRRRDAQPRRAAPGPARGPREMVVDLVVDRLSATPDQGRGLPIRSNWPSGRGDRATVLAQKTAGHRMAGTRLTQRARLRNLRGPFRAADAAPFFLQSQRRAPARPAAAWAGSCAFAPGTGRAGPRKVGPGRGDQGLENRREEPDHQTQRLVEAIGRTASVRPGPAVEGAAAARPGGSCREPASALFSFKLRRMREARRCSLPASSRTWRSRSGRPRATGFEPGCRPHGERGLSGVPRRPPECAKRLRATRRRAVLSQFLAMDAGSAHAVARDFAAFRGAEDPLREVVGGIEQRLHFLVETGLGYLTLDATTRPCPAARPSGCGSPRSSAWA